MSSPTADRNSVEATLDYLRDHPSAALPPSPLSPQAYGRPRAPTPSAAVPDPPSTVSSDFSLYPLPILSSICDAESPVVDSPPPFLPRSPPPRPPLDSDNTDTAPAQSMNLPDPSQFPEPHLFRRPHHHLTSLPALSSAGSSSASTRSSAYTSSGSALASGDYGHVHVASGDDDAHSTVGITSDSVLRMLAEDPNASSSARALPSRTPIDPSRWSESYGASRRSRSSSIGNTNSTAPAHETSPPVLQNRPSYDMGWQTVDERDEVGVSEDETDDDHVLLDDADITLDENHEERTSAAVIADEGRGLIVQADNTPIVQLQVQPGTTHLLIGSSSTPNSVPAFLTSTLPQISTTLLCLDISANFLGALPPVLSICESLEELNVASNPLRVLPVFLSHLTNLRVLIADATGITTLPDALVELDKLHTISVKRNKMHALPSWLCLLPALQTLCVDGNPFQGPWKALVEPLLAKLKSPMTPVYPPSTPMFPLPSASIQSSTADTETDTDVDDFSDHDAGSLGRNSHFLPEEEDHTITPDRAPLLERAVTSPYPVIANNPPVTQPRALTRIRTTPNRAHFEQTRARNATSTAGNRAVPVNKQQDDAGYHGDHELRKMKSAGDLRRGKTPISTSPDSIASTPVRPALSQYQTSLSSSNLLGASPPPAELDRAGLAKRFASLGPTSSISSVSLSSSMASRPQLTQSMWEGSPENTNHPPSSTRGNRMSFSRGNTNAASSTTALNQEPGASEERPHHRQRPPKEGKEKGSRWGFLKKMSMGKMKPDTSPPHPSQIRGIHLGRSHTSSGTPGGHHHMPLPSLVDRFSKAPQVDLRLSTTGNLDALPAITALPAIAAPSTPPQTQKGSSSLTVPPRTESLLLPPQTSQRGAKRRSFLPVEAPGALALNIPIPEASTFVPGVTATNDDSADGRATTPSPVIDNEQYLRREQERARDAYMRALRSVMAYLKDMNDLSLSQQPNSMSMYGDDALAARSRRPTMVEGQREVSMALSGTSTEVSGQLRSSESIAGLRSGTASQTASVATTDSNGSSEERKFKDDKSKRAMVIREIVLTERTYVKGLQELVDIYIKPASVSVNLLSGVGSSKDTVVPASERRVVFGGIDALFSFHKDSFLPALEIAAAPLMKSSAEVQAADPDGQLSLNVAKAVGNIFVKHAAFMRMYSSYINNFDSSVQRVKYWSTEKNSPSGTSSGSSSSQAPSTAQIVGLSLTMSAITAPGITPEGGSSGTGIPNLTTSQRRRIKSYLKRCRMNPRHTQLNLEGYLLLPVQRIPRYRLLLEELLRNTPPTYQYVEDSLEHALAEISLLANNMNEGKRESESRRKLVQWQTRIRGKFPSPLVQPHRRLIMDGPLLLTRVVRKAVVSFEAINAQGDATMVQVDCLAPELTPRPLVGILCNDLLVLCRDPSEGQDPTSFVDLWAVLRMQTLPQPASIVHGNALRLVDNKAILYFDAPSPSDALTWYRAINLHIPASKT